MTGPPVLQKEDRALTKEDVLGLLREDAAGLTPKSAKLDTVTAKRLAEFEKKYGLILGLTGPLERRAFQNGERYLLHFVFQTPLPEKRSEEFLKDVEKLAALGISISIQPDGSIIATNSNFIPTLPEAVQKRLAGLLEKANKFAEKGDLERAMSMHLAFVAIIECYRKRNDAERSAKLAEQYNIGVRDVEGLDIFKGPDKRFSPEKFEELMGISYDDYKLNGLSYIARLKFEAAATRYDMAVSYYLESMDLMAKGKPKKDYEKRYMLAKEQELSGEMVYRAGAFVLRNCRLINEGPRTDLQATAALIVGTGLSSEYDYLDADRVVQRRIDAGEVKIGDRKVVKLSELMLTTDWGKESAQPAVR